MYFCYVFCSILCIYNVLNVIESMKISQNCPRSEILKGEQTNPCCAALPFMRCKRIGSTPVRVGGLQNAEHRLSRAV